MGSLTRRTKPRRHTPSRVTSPSIQPSTSHPSLIGGDPWMSLEGPRIQILTLWLRVPGRGRHRRAQPAPPGRQGHQQQGQGQTQGQGSAQEQCGAWQPQARWWQRVPGSGQVGGRRGWQGRKGTRAGRAGIPVLRPTSPQGVQPLRRGGPPHPAYPGLARVCSTARRPRSRAAAGRSTGPGGTCGSQELCASCRLPRGRGVPGCCGE